MEKRNGRYVDVSCFDARCGVLFVLSVVAFYYRDGWDCSAVSNRGVRLSQVNNNILLSVHGECHQSVSFALSNRVALVVSGCMLEYFH